MDNRELGKALIELGEALLDDRTPLVVLVGLAAVAGLRIKCSVVPQEENTNGGETI